jgi:cytochrome c oxidase assembly factor CtaG
MSSVAGAVFASWSVPFRATLVVLFALIVYVRGWTRLNQLRLNLLPKWRLSCFVAGLASFWVAIASPLDAFANFLLTAHMIQHMLIMFVAPPLLLLGSPQNPILRGLPQWAVRDVAGPFLTWPLLKRFGRAVTHPVFCWLAATLALVGWHIPAAYDLALASPGWHEVEHACLFGTSLLFWWPVVQPWPVIPRWTGWTTPVYLLFGDLVTTALSGVLCFSDRLLYPAYAAAPRFFDLSALNDQVMAGAIMWVFGSFILVSAAVITTIRLLEPSVANRKPAVKGLSRPAARPSRPAFDLLRTPIVGSLLRARYGRRALQTILLILVVAVIADGFFGHPMAPMNLAGAVPWTYGRAVIVVALLTVGNLFCMACPFTLPRELGRRLGLRTRPWPRALRSKWLAVTLLVLFFWAYEAFDLWDSPHLTALLLVGYFVAAFAVDTFFRDASFCKYVCPIGQFNFLSSLVSPLEVRVRNHEACNSCATHDCVRGSESQRGCELHLFLPHKVGNMDCTFCLDCVKACPHENIGILAIAPGRDLMKDPIRSSVGRFSHRPDIAAGALVLVFSAFVSAAAMVAPVAAWRDHVAEHYSMGSTLPINSLFLLIGLVLAPPTLMGAAILAGRPLAHIATSRRELFCRFSLALLPVGLAMWGAHVLFHLSTAWRSAWLVVQRVAGDLGVDLPGTPHWTPSSPLFGADVMLDVQLCLLDAGILLSLYAGWRIAREYTNCAQDGLRLLTPWATVAALLYAAGIWILLQPMQMRGMIHA